MLTEEQTQIITFTLGDEKFGFSIEQVLEVMRPKDITVTKVPKALDFTEGVINLRGYVVPLLDLRTRFGLARKEYEKETRIIILSLTGRHIGFVVDRVNEVITFRSDELAPPPAEILPIGSHFIANIGRKEGELVLILDVEKILTYKEKIEIEEAIETGEEKEEGKE